MSSLDSASSGWKLKAETARLDEKEGKIYLTSPRIRFLSNSVETSEITSLAGIMDLGTKDAELTSQVKVNAKKDSMILDTERLFFGYKKNKIWTNEKVRILKGKTVINARGFIANPDLSDIEILRHETVIDTDK